MEITPPTPSTLPVEAAHSSAREKVLEHLFVGELLRCLWRRGIRNMEVLRAEVDMGGYDLVMAVARSEAENGPGRLRDLRNGVRAPSTM